MPDTTPTTELRAAAELLRQLATAASTDESGRPTARWAVRYQPGVTPGAPPQTGRSCYLDAVDEADADGRGARSLLHGGGGGSRPRPPSVAPQHGRYMAAMGPEAGLALADWLDAAAEYYVPGPAHPTHVAHALAVARLVLGTTDQQPTPPAEACTEHGAACHTREWPAPGTNGQQPPTAEICICGHTEGRHFEDCCQVCDCGDFLVPEAAREMITRWRTAALNTRDIRRTAVLNEAVEVAGQMGGRFGTDDHGDIDTGWNDACAAIATELRRMADEAQQPEAAGCKRCGCSPRCCACDFDEAQQPEPEAAVPVQHAPGKVICCPDCRAKSYTVCRDEPAADRPDTETEAAK